MGKRKNKNNGNNGGGGGGGNNEGGEKKKEEQQKVQNGGGGGGGEGEKKQKDGGDKANPITVVLKVDMHCEGCVSKIVRFARGLPGVEGVKADLGANKLTVVGMVDPSEVRDSLQAKIKKKVDLVSPQPKKEDSNQEKDGQKRQQKQKQQQEQQPSEKKQESEKKPKEAAVTTAVLKLGFHCQGCVEKIHKTVIKAKGVQEMAIDRQKETITVKGTMDAKALAEALKERLKRPVEIVPPKKEKEDKDDGGGGKKKGSGGGGGGQGQGAGGDDSAKLEGSQIRFIPVGYGPDYGYPGQPIYGNGYMGHPVYVTNGYMGQPVYGYGQEYGYGYGYGYGHGHGHHQVPGYPVHMKFNDENPNACSIM